MQAATVELAGTGWAAEYAHALTWTFLHSLWIGASVACCLYGFLRLVHVRRARLRYAASTGALFSVPLIALWTLSRELDTEAGDFFSLLDQASSEGAPFSSAIFGSLGMLVAWADELRASLAGRLEPLEETLALSWALLALLALVRVGGGFALLARRASREFRPAAPDCQVRLALLARRLGIARRVRLYWSDAAEVPMAVGAFRPKVVLPSTLREQVERGELDLVLLHELAHVRRGDGFARLIEAVFQALFVLHPCMPWIAARVAREREHCCDDIAVGAGADRLGYVRALAELETSRCERSARRRRWWRPVLVREPALRATDGALVERIRRLTSLTQKPPRTVFVPACAGLLLGASGLALGALPTHDLRGANVAFVPATPAGIERSFDVTVTSAHPSGESDPSARPMIARMIVLNHAVEASGGEPAKFVIGEAIELRRGMPLGETDFAVHPAQPIVRIRALRSAR